MNNPLTISFQAIQNRTFVDTISETSFPGLFTIQRPVLADERGDFWEVVRISDLEQSIQRPFKIQQVNRSRNVKKGTLRGIHVANWDKLIFIVRGSVFIALIDLRKNSPSYQKIYTDIIGDESKTISILIPAGFGNSYQALTDNTDYMYAVSEVWSQGSEIGILWNDPALNIQWPITTPILSPKDKENKLLSELISDFKS